MPTTYSFNIKSVPDLFNTFYDDLKEYQADDLNSRKALHCAFTAWHILEWIYHENKKKTLNSYKNEREYQNHIINKIPKFKLIKILVNGTKHHTLNYKTDLKDTNLIQGDFSNDYSNDYDISRLQLDMKDGTTYDFQELITDIESELKTILKEFNYNIS
ncbi:hypothetical protein [Lentimicrobium sp. S6]|uniref:hypothetical protein n=1 Tax=Lentimicrobium sp. S6 TaxID=2735872 RepID=UPI0015562C29|nr:hypothetical protein [Lentimicrobium sp. S6]NPD47111.1 hypothetical protein [Lentimicrobium sp. S6]